MQMHCRQAATETETERKLAREARGVRVRRAGGWGRGAGLKAQIRRVERNVLTLLQDPPHTHTHNTIATSFSSHIAPPSLPPSPPISHLMCGGCWEPHAKMNNNRLLVTIAHEHTPPPSLAPSLPRSVIFFLTFSLVLRETHKQRFPCDLRTH